MQPGSAVPIQTNTDVAAARRAGAHFAQQAEFGEREAANLAIVVTEAATNVLKHGGGGEILLHRFGSRIEIAALDNGPGIADAAKCFEDGFSTSGTPGSGLGAISRLSSFRDLYSVPGCGAALVVHVNGTGSRGVINIPYPGEQACGDTWTFDQTPDRARLFVVDGLGHGVAAAAAAHAAANAVESNPTLKPAGLLDAVHARLRSTRGAAASVADILACGDRVEFAGVGNVSGAIMLDALTRRQMIPPTAFSVRRSGAFRVIPTPPARTRWLRSTRTASAPTGPSINTRASSLATRASSPPCSIATSAGIATMRPF